MRWIARGCILLAACAGVANAAEPTLRLPLRTRVEVFKGSGRWRPVSVEARVPTARTALLICDMWDKHWCGAATKRFDALARQIAPVVEQARAAGVQVLHCPSETMACYADTPQRRRMQAAPSVPMPKPRKLPDHRYPIEARTNGGCGCQPPCRQHRAWSRQTPHIRIAEPDGISDSGVEVYRFLRQRGIDTVIVVGVATNMCIMARPFGIKQMSRWGVRCILVRDLTDTMYVSKDPPHVPHDQGTALMVEHIEKYWCPSISSRELLLATEMR